MVSLVECENTHGKSKNPAHGSERERSRRHCRRTEQAGRRGCVVRAGQRQLKQRGAGEPAERIGLTRPVEAARTVGLTPAMVLATFVISDDGSNRIWHFGVVGWGWFQVRGRYSHSSLTMNHNSPLEARARMAAWAA